jgi:hypothetical protein
LLQPTLRTRFRNVGAGPARAEPSSGAWSPFAPSATSEPLAPCRCAAAASRAPERRNISEPLESRPFHLGAVEPARCAAAASTRAPHHLGPRSPSTSSATSGAWSPFGSQRQPATRAISEAVEPVHADLRHARTGPRRARCAGVRGVPPGMPHRARVSRRLCAPGRNVSTPRRSEHPRGQSVLAYSRTGQP